VEQFGARGRAERVQAFSWPALELVGPDRQRVRSTTHTQLDVLLRRLAARRA
jgi:hypothetical protein